MFRQADSGTIRRSTRVVIGGIATSAVLLCVAVAPVQAAPKPQKPPAVSRQQVQQAASQKQAQAHMVGVLSAQIAQSLAQEHSLEAAAELAEQKYAYAMQLLTDATHKATAAQADVDAAVKSIQKARTNLTSYVRSSYMAPTVGSSTIDLLTAQDPTALLQGGDYQNYISNHHLDALGALDRATVAKSNAEAKAQTAKLLQQKRTNDANAARQAAQQAYQQQQSQTAQLQSDRQAKQMQLAAAQRQLALLTLGRLKYVQYNAMLVYQARQAFLAAAAKRAAAEARQRQIEQQQEQQRLQQQQNSGNGGDSGSSGSSSPVQTTGWGAPAGPSGGGWSLAKGQAAANKALSQLGVRYAWAGGNYSGPTYGVNSPGTDGWNDSQVYGFDCSGLALFAWYPALSMSHLASNQYWEAGSYHPSSNDFQPGDLLFWSDGGAGAIHHVAIYIGGGNVVQAPNSGDVVKITPWDQVDYGYFGATRPLT